MHVQAPYKNQLEGLLLNNVMPCFDSPYGHLRAKACWVAGQFADIEFREGSGRGQVFGNLFQKVVNAFQDPHLPVSIRVCLCYMITAYIPTATAAFWSVMCLAMSGLRLQYSIFTADCTDQFGLRRRSAWWVYTGAPCLLPVCCCFMETMVLQLGKIVQV